MNPHYNQNYTEEEIDVVLEKIKSCVGNNKYTIALNENRQENIDFINAYNIRSNKQKSILWQLRTKDFCEECRNDVTFTVINKQMDGTIKGETYTYL
ncbi:MAG: hypothetical protein RR564_07215, partial [Eubacterium sp.]